MDIGFVQILVNHVEILGPVAQYARIKGFYNLRFS